MKAALVADTFVELALVVHMLGGLALVGHTAWAGIGASWVEHMRAASWVADTTMEQA